MAGPTYPTKAWIRERFDYWYDRLLLHPWDIDLYVKDARYVDDDRTVGSANPKPIYLAGTVSIARKHSKRDVENTIVHELCHFLTADLKRSMMDIIDSVVSSDHKKSLQATISDANERLISHLANALTKTADKHMTTGGKRGRTTQARARSQGPN